uniref:NADH-ubiquinone oxidoreductase chain 6 n=1 Tax=Phanogenia gracilis TaxID=329963 RepID=Q2QJD2_9ECHI|nr:NADH dehydrogenase subunit 6 [Phanogenia gracilis]AAY51834.1 NADH dehydrogenase subunit 6 [Phanogenia gracilis]
MNIYISIILTLLGTSLVFYSLSPYFSALGLVIVSISSCLILLQTGMNFLALIILLVYMGGMLIVFIYSSALSAERFPTISNINEIITLCLFILFWNIILFENNNWNSVNNTNISNSISIEGASYLFSPTMIWFFLFAGYILLISLIAVLNISQENESGSLQAL